MADKHPEDNHSFNAIIQKEIVMVQNCKWHTPSEKKELLAKLRVQLQRQIRNHDGETTQAFTNQTQSN